MSFARKAFEAVDRSHISGCPYKANVGNGHEVSMDRAVPQKFFDLLMQLFKSQRNGLPGRQQDVMTVWTISSLGFLLSTCRTNVPLFPGPSTTPKVFIHR